MSTPPPRTRAPRPVRAVYAREASITWGRPLALSDVESTNRPDSAARYFAKVLPLGDPREHFAVLALDIHHRPIGHYVVSIGSIDTVLVHPREVFRFAVLASAKAIVLAHTHPSGRTTPSPDDLMLTKRLVQAGDVIGIPVVDHLIVADGGNYTSLREFHLHLFSS